MRNGGILLIVFEKMKRVNNKKTSLDVNLVKSSSTLPVTIEQLGNIFWKIKWNLTQQKGTKK